MFSPNSAFRLIADIVGTDGASHNLDTDDEAGQLRLDGYRVDAVTRVVVEAADTDVSVDLGFDAVAVVVFSDEPVTMRLGVGEVSMTNGRLWCWVGEDAATVVFAGGVLIFDGNGVDDAVVLVVAVADAASVGTGGTPPSPDMGLVLPAAEDTAKGDVLSLNGDGELVLADADTATTRQEAILIGIGTILSGNSGSVGGGQGDRFFVSFDVAPAATDNRKPCYLSQTRGRASMAPPDVSGTSIVRLGIVQGADGILTLVPIIWSPQFVSNIP